MNPLWHLVWAIPTVVVLGALLSSYWPLGKDPEVPYVGFDDRLDNYLRDTGRDPESYGRRE